MPTYTDQTGSKIDIPAVPRRIISLVPSQTEFLYALGLEAEVIGITKFCIHPNSWFQHKTRIGGTKDLHIYQIIALAPDLIIANKEENTAAQVLQLAEIFPVYTSDIANLPDALGMMAAIGQITAKQEQATVICSAIQAAFDQLKPPPTSAAPRTAYLIWKDPYMTVGGDTFIHDMLTRSGFKNIFGTHSRYPEITLEELKAAAVELLLLSSEPYPFQEKHIKTLQAELPGTRIMLADGEYFSWYGSRLLGAPAYFTGIIEQFSNKQACQ